MAAAVGAADRVPDALSAGTPRPLRAELEALLRPEDVLGRVSDIVRYASDASPYRLVPNAVVRPRDVDDIVKLVGWARRSATPLTFRAGGTSLNGQGQTDSLLVDVRHHWLGVEVLDDGARVRVRPGTVLGHVNRALAPLGRKLGPDPASTDIACVGGVVANNSGGMRCGVTHDSYQTVSSLTFVTASGAVIDTAAPDAAERFAAAEPELAAGLARIRDEIGADSQLSERIRTKFAIKNTTGYRLCAFLDADEPVEIFRRLLVGAEGTLAFLAEVVFDTLPVPPRTTVAWLHFPDVDAAVGPVPELVGLDATAVELMVAPALIVASHSIPGTPEHWKELPPDSAALLVEFRAEDNAALDRQVERGLELLSGHTLIREPEFTREADQVELFWSVREGMHGLVGRLRPPGTALIVEDVCVPPAQIAEAAKELQALLGKHGFLTGVAGHASAGNLHFMLTPDFAKQEDLDRYDAFMGELVELVLDKYDGSLKAEHGTGVNMAPFVEREWGERATELMWRIKGLADPDNLLAPGVVLNRDPGVHLRNLRTTPEIPYEEANTCVECGFCEPVCPSRLLTTTPRQRIVLLREMARQPEGSPVQRALREEFEYDGLDTCAVDGTCALACPLGIDTGKVVKEMRAERHSPRGQRIALAAAKRWAGAERAARAGLRAGRLSPRVPKRIAPVPPPAKRLPETAREGAAAVYFPACINRIFGGPDGERSLPAALVALSERAGVPLWIPPDTAGHCCGTPWASKGYTEGHRFKTGELMERLERWTESGRLPVVVDASSCTHAIADEVAARELPFEVLDSIAWARDRLLPRLTIQRRLESVALHPTCSTRHLGLAGALTELGEALADEVVVPRVATCCGFAGDRGYLHPELTDSATSQEAEEIRSHSFDAHLSSNRTCELGLERATGRPYASFVFALEELSRP